MIYLDNASTTKIDDRVLKTMMPYLKDEYGNAGTLYSLGRSAAHAVDIARQQVADFIGASPNQIIFTSGGTEANNLVFVGLRDRLISSGKTRIITSEVEHDSVLRASENLGEPFEVVRLQPDNKCVISPNEVERALDQYDDVGLVSIMHMNNETGAYNRVDQIGEVCKKHNVLFHTDCVQSAACLAIRVDQIGCDFLSLSSHKIHGPKGVGALFVKDKSLISPLIYGGHYQEFGYRGGTENVAGIVGFGKACDILKKNFGAYKEQVNFHAHNLFYGIQRELGAIGLDGIFHLNGGNGVPFKTMNVRFDGVDAETLLLLLDNNGVCVSAGSACTSHESAPSHVLMAMGMSPEKIRNSIRLSVSRMSTEDEIEQASKIIATSVVALLECA